MKKSTKTTFCYLRPCAFLFVLILFGGLKLNCESPRSGQPKDIGVLNSENFPWLQGGLGDPLLYLSEQDKTLRLTGSLMNLPAGSMPNHASLEVFGKSGLLHVVWNVHVGDGSLFLSPGTFDLEDFDVIRNKAPRRHRLKIIPLASERTSHQTPSFSLNDQIWLHPPTNYAISKDSNLQKSLVTLQPEDLRELQWLLKLTPEEKNGLHLPVLWTKGRDPLTQKYIGGVDKKPFPNRQNPQPQHKEEVTSCNLWDLDAIVCLRTQLKSRKMRPFATSDSPNPVCYIKENNDAVLVDMNFPQVGQAWIEKSSLCSCDKRLFRNCRSSLKTAIQCLWESCDSANLLGEETSWKDKSKTLKEKTKDAHPPGDNDKSLWEMLF